LKWNEKKKLKKNGEVRGLGRANESLKVHCCYTTSWEWVIKGMMSQKKERGELKPKKG
jgi:hypothetical protein